MKIFKSDKALSAEIQDLDLTQDLSDEQIKFINPISAKAISILLLLMSF